MPQQLQIIVIICARNTTGWFRIAVTSTALWSNMPYKSLQKIDWKSKNSYMIGYHIRVANPLHHQIVIVIMPTWTGNFLALSRVSTPPPNTFVPSAPAWLSSLHSTAQIDSHMFQLLWQGLVSSIWQQYSIDNQVSTYPKPFSTMFYHQQSIGWTNCSMVDLLHPGPPTLPQYPDQNEWHNIVLKSDIPSMGIHIEILESL